MYHKYREPEQLASCAPTALGNCLINKGKKVTEATIRKYCKTTREGTSPENLELACQHFGYDTKKIEYISRKVFKNHLIDGLKAGHQFILMIEDYNHYIPALEYKNRRIVIVDGDFKKYANKSILQTLTVSRILNMANCFDKFKGKYQFFALELIYKGE